MRITSWNVNGIRATIKKNAFDWIGTHNADIVCLQEIKAKEDQIEKELIQSFGYECTVNSAERPGYSGVLTMHKAQPEVISLGMGKNKFDIEGRIIQYTYPDFELFNIYFPNGGRDLIRVPYKLDFYKTLLEKCDKLIKDGHEIILNGDFNTAHNEIDLKNPSSNKKNTGFLPEERVWIDKYLEHGFYDVFREMYPDKVEYTWWSYRFNARANNVGWRLDYFMVTKSILEKVIDLVHHTDVDGSDHCPVTLVLRE
jgi:exodeoxyribonuclease-3